MKIKAIVLAAALVGATSLSASAATMLSDGDFTIDGQQQSGNCPTSVTPCIVLTNAGPNSTAELTYSGGTFDLAGFFYSLQGTGAQVTVSTTTPGYTPLSFTNQQGSVTGLEAILNWTGVGSVLFSNTGNGTVRIGGLSGSVPMSPVPLPTSGLMLLGALGLGVAARRKAA